MKEAAVLTIIHKTEMAPSSFFVFSKIHVYRVERYAGTITESDEMAPRWFDKDALPFDQMWADDKHWYPRFVAGRNLRGFFEFTEASSQGEMLSWRLEEVEGPLSDDAGIVGPGAPMNRQLERQCEK